ncbi:L-aspartate oxidase [Selenihalanaerobacter shriftii]|uniref:L-aspartate oxidase n=1 Tax=Selenihalanaerobacter shriftii TaxID=142842 RepID=A0A1T4LCK3_9FIRM|nr:L-aspartate oxidase [Selenihalanaerobacter shriftii]SJZ52469.1 L-aspartate oxidase [Selenihalanaerobacter shriftii]
MVPRYLVNFDLSDLDKIETDFLVIGSGIAGLFSALNLAEKGEVTLLTKEEPKDCNTEYAQGGIAAVISEDDTPELHYRDTLDAGDGLCNPYAVKILVNEGSQRIKELFELGVDFDREGDKVALTKEGAHSCRRILHAGGDATGTEIRSSLFEKVLNKSQIKVENGIFVIDLLTEDDRCHGALAYDNQQGEYVAYLAKAVVLATGGAGQLYQETSNPEVATGDGIALAYRAGVEVMDLEFVQFHPTTLQLNGIPNFLISEAVRGEGAVLRDQSGDRFMPKYHELAELAPRDVVARAIYQEMEKNNIGYVYLDVTGLETEFIKRRFPTIYQTCLERGINITKDFIPVSPAAHYFMGGIKTNTNGETNLLGLFACGETASLGVHGANRLASNSLLDGLVYGKRVAKKAIEYMIDLKLDFKKLKINNNNQQLIDKPLSAVKEKLQLLMMENVGIIRNKNGLNQTMNEIKELINYLNIDIEDIRYIEVQNLINLAYLVVKASLIRKESRGAHYREDYPETKQKWQKHIVLQKDKEWEGLNLEFK